MRKIGSGVNLRTGASDFDYNVREHISLNKVSIKKYIKEKLPLMIHKVLMLNDVIDSWDKIRIKKTQCAGWTLGEGWQITVAFKIITQSKKGFFENKKWGQAVLSSSYNDKNRKILCDYFVVAYPLRKPNDFASPKCLKSKPKFIDKEYKKGARIVD